MPAQRIPTQVLELSGAFKKNPQRKRTGEPVPSGPIGPPHSSLNADEIAAYNELVSLAPPNVLTNADGWSVELAARIMAAIRKGDNVRASEQATLVTLLGKLGMNPSDRSRLTTPPDESCNTDDPWASFAQA